MPATISGKDERRFSRAPPNFAKSGGKLVKLEFPKTEIQVFGYTAIVYSDYSYELEVGGQKINQAGRVTEIFVNRKGKWVNPGWHLDSGK